MLVLEGHQSLFECHKNVYKKRCSLFYTSIHLCVNFAFDSNVYVNLKKKKKKKQIGLFAWLSQCAHVIGARSTLIAMICNRGISFPTIDGSRRFEVAYFKKAGSTNVYAYAYRQHRNHTITWPRCIDMVVCILSERHHKNNNSNNDNDDANSIQS